MKKWKQSRLSPTKRKKIIGLSYRWGPFVLHWTSSVGFILVKTLQNKHIYRMAPCPLRDQSLQNHHTKLWSSGFLSEGKEHWQPPLTYKYRLQHSFSSYPHRTMARLFFFFLRGGEQIHQEKTNILKTGSQCHFYIWFKIYKANSWCGAL